MGSYFPVMGMILGGASGIADVLFNGAVRRLLGLIYGQPDREFGSSQLISSIGMGTGGVHRQLQRLTTAGLLTVSEIGNQKFYRANRKSPIFAELVSITAKTVGLSAQVAAALAPISSRIDAAFIFGSVARGKDHSGSDVDLMILSESVDYSTVFDLLLPVEKTLGRRISPMLLSTAEWRRRAGEPGSFIAQVAAAPVEFLIGDSGDIT